jgi:hypothetical protein
MRREIGDHMHNPEMLTIGTAINFLCVTSRSRKGLTLKSFDLPKLYVDLAYFAYFPFLAVDGIRWNMTNLKIRTAPRVSRPQGHFLRPEARFRSRFPNMATARVSSFTVRNTRFVL